MVQMTPAEQRAEAEKKLAPLGRKRIKLLAALEEIDAELRPLIREAREVEVSLRRITALTAVAPNTVRKWEKEG